MESVIYVLFGLLALLSLCLKLFKELGELYLSDTLDAFHRGKKSADLSRAREHAIKALGFCVLLGGFQFVLGLALKKASDWCGVHLLTTVNGLPRFVTALWILLNCYILIPKVKACRVWTIPIKEVDTKILILDLVDMSWAGLITLGTITSFSLALFTGSRLMLIIWTLPNIVADVVDYCRHHLFINVMVEIASHNPSDNGESRTQYGRRLYRVMRDG